MEVSECELVEWYGGGNHDFRWPDVEATEEEKATALKLMERVGPVFENKNPTTARPEERTVDTARKESTKTDIERLNRKSPAEKAAMHTHERNLAEEPADGPAAKVQITASSGFYVRSFAYDLGISCKSLAAMAELCRTRQGDYTLAEPAPEGMIPCLTYQELDQGEDVWGPKIARILESWMSNNVKPREEPIIDDRDRSRRWQGRGGGGRFQRENRKRQQEDSPRRRQTSSPLD
jgi:tRNA pseudouridine55 synthase